MTQSLSNVQVKEFSTRVKHAYQALGKDLFHTVTNQDGVVGNTVQFPKMGYVSANRGAYLAAANPQDPGFTQVTATLDPYYTDIPFATLQQLTVNFSIQENLVKATAMGFGRRRDQILIDAWTADAGNAIASNYGADVGMNYDKFLRIVEIFDDNNIPYEDRWFALSPAGKRQLFKDIHFVNQFYLGQPLLATGQFSFQQVLGMNIRTIGKMPIEGGLPLAGNIRTGFAWHTMSTGFAVNQDMLIEANKIPLQHGYLVTGSAQMGAAVIDNVGVISVDYDETFVPPLLASGKTDRSK